MARKVLGYIELVWTCDSCGTKNPGAIRSCTSCGAPQPFGVKFERVDPDTFNFIKDEALIRMAQSGPDKHCPFCGTRNLADAQVCVQCGGDLTVGATSRPAGAVVEEPVVPQPQKPMPQPVAATASPAPAKPTPKWLPILGILLLILCVAFSVWYFSRAAQSESHEATVAQTYWLRQVQIEAYQVVREADWSDNIPAGANTYNCSMRHRYDSDSYRPESTEVCGEPYTIDTGTGIGEVVQDCVYRVYDEYCSYDTMQWVVIDTLSQEGYNTTASWPARNLANDQRIGNATETYIITFQSGGDEYTYRTKDYDLFQQAYEGSQWVIEVNGFGDITAIEPD